MSARARQHLLARFFVDATKKREMHEWALGQSPARPDDLPPRALAFYSRARGWGGSP